MKRLTIFIVLLVLCILFAIWAPWTSLNFSLAALFGIKQNQEVSGLQVYSLSGKIDISLDGNKIGTATEGADPFAKDNITPGDHLISLSKESDISNAYWTFNKVVTFTKNTTVVASYNLGPDDEFSEGHVIYASLNSNPENKLNLALNVNVAGASLTIDTKSKEDFVENNLNTELDLSSQHTILIHADGYEDLQFTILPTDQADRDKLQGMILNIDAHLMLQPLQITNK